MIVVVQGRAHHVTDQLIERRDNGTTEESRGIGYNPSQAHVHHGSEFLSNAIIQF